MSAIPPGAIAVLTAGTPLQGLWRAVLVTRAFVPQDGPFPAPTVWVEEQHTDNVIITEHPVERGAPITDHAFARGPELTVRLAWGGFGLTLADAQAAYSQILTLKDNRVLFSVQTGKRLYTNMLISEVSVTTDQHSEYILLATLRCRQLILVNTSIVSVPAAPQDQSNASSTTPATINGSVPLVPAAAVNPAGLPPSISGYGGIPGQVGPTVNR